MSDDATYTDDDLVYVDMNGRQIVGVVTWKNEGIHEKRERPDDRRSDEDDNDDGKRRRRKPKKRYYPVMSYRTAKIICKIEKEDETQNYKPLDEAIGVLMEGI